MALEPLYEYIVQVVNKDGTTVSFNTLAHSKYHAREKIYAKFSAMQPDQSKYSFGRKALASKRGLHSLN